MAMKHFAWLALLAGVSCSSNEASEKTDYNPPRFNEAGAEQGQAPGSALEKTRMVTTLATVTAVDAKSRMMTLRGPQGNSISFKVGEQVKNLDQIKVGDNVVVDYRESLAVQVVKPGAAGSGEDLVVDKAETSSKTGDSATQKMTVFATVEQIDYSEPSITLRGSEGSLTK